MIPKKERIAEFKAAEKLLTPILETLYSLDGKYPAERFFRINKPCFVKSGRVSQPTYLDKEGKEQTTEFVALGAHAPNPLLSSLFNDLQSRIEPFFYGEIPLHNIHLHLDPLGPISEELRNPQRTIPMPKEYQEYPAWKNVGYGQGYFPETRHFEKRCSLVFDVDRVDKMVNGIKAVASEDDIQKIKKATDGIVAFLKPFGLQETFQTLTGNGLQAVFLFKPFEISQLIIAEILRGVNRKFAEILKNCNASIDENLASPTQAIRLPGFLNIKPQYVEIPEQGRVHRFATLIDFTGHINDYEDILRLHGELRPYIEDRKEEKGFVSFPSKSYLSGNEIDWSKGIKELLDSSGVEYNNTEAGVFKLKRCLFCDNKNHAVIYCNQGIPRYSCHAGSCKNTWQDVIKKLGPCKKYSQCVYCGQEIYFLEHTCYDIPGGKHYCIKDANSTLSILKLPCSNTAKKPLAEPLTKEELAQIENEKQSFGEYPEKTITLYTARTGAGKTFLFCRECVDRARKRLPTVLFLPSIELVYEAEKTIDRISRGEHLARVLISSSIQRGEEETNTPKNKKSYITVTTFAYLFRKGESGNSFQILTEIFGEEKPLVLIDESHDFMQKLFTSVELSARYETKGEGRNMAFRRLQTCPKKCEGCIKKERPLRVIVGNVPTFRPISILTPANLDEHDPPDYSFIHHAGEFEQVYGTLYRSQVFKIPDFGSMLTLIKQPTQDYEKEEYVRSLLEFSYLPFLKKSLPTKDGDKIKFPRVPCDIEEFSTIDLFPLINLFSRSEKVVFASATPDPYLEEVIAYIAPKFGLAIRKKENRFTPFLFHVDSLQTVHNLQLPTIARLLSILAQNKEKTICFIRTEKDLAAFIAFIRDPLNKIDRLGNMCYYNKTTRTYDSLEIDEETALGFDISVVLSTARGVLSKGVNKFSSFATMIIDCNQHLPYRALHYITSKLSRGEISEMLQSEIRVNLQQQVGRLFRSELERKEGQQVNDTKRCKLLLFNVPSELQWITVDTSLCWFQEIHKEFFFFPCDSNDQQGADIANAIIALGKDEKPVNVLEKRTKELAQKRKNALTKKQRALTEDTRPQERKSFLQQKKDTYKQEKLDKLKEKLASLANLEWKAVYRKLNLARLPENERRELEEFFTTECAKL